MNQAEIPGTEVPKNPDIERALDAWLAACDGAKRAAETKKLAHAVLVLQMQQAGLERYPYLDPSSGKKKQVVIARDPKARSTSAPGGRRARKANDSDLSDAERAERKTELLRKKSDSESNSVESRRVRREDVAELREEHVDPFAATRAAMEGAGL